MTQKEQKVNIQTDMDLVRRTEYQDDRYDDLYYQNYARHPITGQTQNSYFDQRHYKPNPQRLPEYLQTSNYLKG